MRFKETIGISHSLRKLDLRIESALNEGLKRLGLSHAQYTALSSLEQAPGQTNAELARECAVTPQTMNRMIQTLTEDGLILKKERKDDTLRVALELSPRAEALVCDAHILVNEIEKKMTRGLSKARITELKAQIEAWERLLD